MSSSKFPLTPHHVSAFSCRGFPLLQHTHLDALFQPRDHVPSCVAPSLDRLDPVQEFQPVVHRLRFSPRLRSRLTLSRRSLLRNPRAFGGKDSHLSFRYSYRHSHFLPVHLSFRSGFAHAGTLPYPCIFIHAKASVPYFSPGHLRRRVSRPVSYYALF